MRSRHKLGQPQLLGRRLDLRTGFFRNLHLKLFSILVSVHADSISEAHPGRQAPCGRFGR